MADIINLSGLAKADRIKTSFGQDNRVDDLSAPVFQKVGGVYKTSASTYAEDEDNVPLTFNSTGRLLVDMSGIELTIGSVSATVDSVYIQSGANMTGSMVLWDGTNTGAITTGSELVITGSVNVDNIAAGSVNITAGDNLIVQGSHAIDAAITAPPVYVGFKAESTVPTEVADGDAVDQWNDTFGRQVIKGTNLGQEAIDVNEIAPALTQTINTVQLSAVGSSAGSHIGAWVNMADFGNKTLYLEYSSGETGGMQLNLEASPDAGSTVYRVGSDNFTDTDENATITNADNHEFIRTTTSVNSGGTLTVTLTGRGGR